MSTYTIRYAEISDMPQIIELCGLHAEYEKAAYEKEGKEARLAAHLFKPDPSVFCYVAESGAELVGYATYSKEFSTWDAAHYIHMDCLYLKEAFRGLGIGQALVQKICEEAKRMNIKQIQWQTPEFNTRAIKFYHRIGATSKAKLRMFLNHPEIEQLCYGH